MKGRATIMRLRLSSQRQTQHIFGLRRGPERLPLYPNERTSLSASAKSEKCRTHASQQESSIQPTRRLERVALACERPHDCVDRVLGNGMAKRDAVFVSGPEMNASPNTRTHHILLCFGQAVPTPRQRSGWKHECSTQHPLIGAN